MAKQTYDQDKIDLIYSYNRLTPLFIRKADFELEKKNLDEAIEILNRGLKYYPNFAAAHLLLGKANALKGNYTEAIENIKKGSELIPSKMTFEFYLNEIENIKNKISLGFSNQIKIEKEPANEKQEPELKSLPKDEKIEDLVKEISPETASNSFAAQSQKEKSFGKNIIVSETLAKIYVSQGEYKEAAEIYKLLQQKHPDKKDYYLKKIQEIESKLP